MKNISTLLFLFAFGLGINTLYAQEPTPLYAGVRYNEKLVEVDTTDGLFTVVGSIDMTTDAGFVAGTFGLALDPTTNEMYILYDNGNDECDRHLGIVNTETGLISDIGNAGNIVDMDFGPDGTLYGTTGSSCAPDYTFVEIDKVDAFTFNLFDHASAIYGSSIGYNPFSDKMFHINNNDYSIIDIVTLIETLETESPGETHAIAFLSEDLAWTISYEERYAFNPLTGVFTYIEDLDDDYHALAFGRMPCTPMELDVTSFSVCVGGEVTLDATAESGAAIIWDGGIFDDIAFFPDVVGTFTYTATTLDEDDCELHVEIEVLPFPTVIPGAGDENFCEDETIVLSAAGDADEYSWDPLDLDPGVGTHTYTLTGSNAGGCESSATLEIIVQALPEINPSVSPELTCLGNDVVFTVSGAETYVWEDPEIEIDESYTTTEAGTITYFVTGTDINGCTNSASIDLEVADAITVTGVSSEEIEGDDGSIAITITGGVPAYIVDWDNDGTGDFDDPASISGLAGGTYTIIVQGSMGCADTVTFKVDSQLAVETFEMSAISIYPNPTVNVVTIELEGAFTFEVTNSNGQIVYKGNAMNIETVDLENLSSGIYYFTIQSEIETSSIRVVKK